MTTPVQADAASRRGRLAIALQEPFTTIARLRANKTVATDAESFRMRTKQVLSMAEAEARAQGYSAEDVRFTLFAVIAFLDETVLNSGQPMFSQWSSRTLQEEVFGVHMAGELFYQYLEQLMGRPNSPDLADMLEVFSLCMLLGFKGRYAASTTGSEVLAILRQLAARIEAMRGALGDLSPQWRPSTADIGRKPDAWIPRLVILAAASAVLAIGLFGYYTVSLRAGAADMRTETSRLSR